jgi:hypothetical protein
VHFHCLVSERDICTKFITPALISAGWDLHTQIREEVTFTKGRIIVRGKLHTRGETKRADYVLYYKPNIPIALIEAKDERTPWAPACSRGWTMPTARHPLCLFQQRQRLSGTRPHRPGTPRRTRTQPR